MYATESPLCPARENLTIAALEQIRARTKGHHRPIVRGDNDIIWRLAHPDLNLTKSEVKVRRSKVSQECENIGENCLFLSVFTPDSSQRNSHGIEIRSFLGKDEMFLSPDLVKRFEQKFGTATVQWSRTGGGPWLTVPRHKYSPSMDAFLAQEAQHKVEPDGPANRSQPHEPGTNRTSSAAGSGR